MGGWFDWLSSTLRYLGLSSKQGKILFLGLDNAGKTTLLGRLKDGKVGSHRPTNHPNKEVFVVGGIEMMAYDLGGHRQARALWKNYFTQVDGIVFLVDAANPERIEESKEQLDLLLNDDMLLTVPFSILGNKVDIPNALPPDVLTQRLGLEGLCTGKQHSDSKAENFRPLEVFMVSVVKGYGYGDAFRWLAHYLEDA